MLWSLETCSDTTGTANENDTLTLFYIAVWVSFALSNKTFQQQSSPQAFDARMIEKMTTNDTITPVRRRTIMTPSIE
jgi:hypothetical protein